MFHDWAYLGQNWPYFEASIYTSAPTSICGRMSGSLVHDGWAVHTTNPNLPQLLVVQNIWFGFNTFTERFDWMRGQQNPVPPYRYPRQCYLLQLHAKAATLGWVDQLASGQIASHTFSPQLPLNTWIKYRWSMWDWPNHIAPTKIHYTLELWNVDHYDVIFDGENNTSRWWNSPTNLFGFWLPGQVSWGNKACAIDDTELWVPTV